MGRISRGRGLEGERLREVFLPMDRQQLSPTEMADEVIPVYPYPTATLKFDDARIQNVAGAAGVTVVDTIPVPVGRYWYIIAIAAFHNDPVDREVELRIVTAAGTQLAMATHRTGTQSSSVQQAAASLPLLISEGMLIRATAAVAAAQVLTLRVLFFEYRLAEPSPSV